jgi:hypothetical protein
LQSYIRIINSSPLFQSVLEAFQQAGGRIFYNPDATSAGYNPDTGDITLKDISGNEFVRLLSHEIGHFYRQTLCTPSVYDTGITENWVTLFRL